MIFLSRQSCRCSKIPDSVFLKKSICGIIGTLSEVFYELSVSNTCPLSEPEPEANGEVSGHGVIGTLSEVFTSLVRTYTWPLSEPEPKVNGEVSGHGELFVGSKGIRK